MTNLLLSIVTLHLFGLGPRRRQKYFYQHTYVAGRNFDYHATGQILKGRLVVLVGYIVAPAERRLPILSSSCSPGTFPRALPDRPGAPVQRGGVAAASFGFASPAARALFLAFLVYPFLAALTLFVAWPFASRALRRFDIGHHHLGAAPLAFSAPIGPLHVGFAAAIAWLLAVGAAIALVAVTGLGGTNALSVP